MPTYKVKVKWGKEVFSDVELTTEEEPLVFKAQVFCLTGVEPQRQKIMVKGVTLKENDWSNIKLKDGVMVLMMGTKEEDVPTKPKEQTVFAEDMTESELTQILDLPVGLTNLGNTCYLNAVLQCFKTVPELSSTIAKFKGKGGELQDKHTFVMQAIRDTYRDMEDGNTPVPLFLVNMFRAAYPRFNEKTDQGTYMQQDANECWTELVRLFKEMLPSVTEDDSTDAAGGPKKTVMEQMFCGVMESEWTCEESEDEPKTKTTDVFERLTCHISQEVKYLHTGISLRLKEQLTKKSETLDRNAVYKKISILTRLPAYLTVEMVRFFYKEKEGVSAKILKDVKFPIILDLFEFCDKNLQNKMLPLRDQYKEMEDREMEEERARAKAKHNETEEVVPTNSLPFSFEDDKGSSNNGFYELQAVLTHQGRSSSSGHYVAWVRWRGKEWVKCDDDKVTPITEEEVLKLSGGGDWHCAYVLLYGPRILRVPKDKNTAEGEEKSTEKKQTDDQPMETE